MSYNLQLLFMHCFYSFTGLKFTSFRSTGFNQPQTTAKFVFCRSIVAYLLAGHMAIFLFYIYAQCKLLYLVKWSGVNELPEIILNFANFEQF